MYASKAARFTMPAVMCAAVALTLGTASAGASVPAAAPLTAAASHAHQAAVTEDRVELAAVSADSATDAWAVGNSSQVLHWNGTAWSEVRVASSTTTIRLDAVAAVSPTDAWAAGQRASDTSDKTLLLHWNGTTWARVPTPNPGGGPRGQDDLTSISMDSATDGWITGSYYGPHGTFPGIVLHWNGTTWTQLSVPEFTGVGAVFALSPTQAWMLVSYESAGVSTYGISSWNGTTWSQPTAIPIPSGATGYGLQSLSADSPTDLWAVGGISGNSSAGKPWAMHWNGTTWTQAATVDPGELSNLTGVTVLSPTDAWAVGYYSNGVHLDQALMLHWNGTAWTRVTTPQPGASSNLYAITAVAPNDIWAAGTTNLYRRPQKSLLLNWNGTTWTQS
jgi:hypothetical protein